MTIAKKQTPLDKNTRYLCQTIDQRTGQKSKAFIATPTDIIEAAETLEGLNAEQQLEKIEYWENQLIDLLANADEIDTLDPDDQDPITITDLVMQVPIFHFSSFKKFFESQPEV